jgi:hypothetical protein
VGVFVLGQQFLIHIRRGPDVDHFPEMILLPKERLDDLEDGFLQLQFMANRIAEEMEQGVAPQSLVPVLRKELESALMTTTRWREARWKVEHGDTHPQGAPFDPSDGPT